MPVIVWNYRFLLGIQEIDQHHKHLVDLLNKTYNEFTERKAVGYLGCVIDELVDYSHYHFDCEERWMIETSYPDLEIHRAEHEIFAKRAAEFKLTHQQNDTYVEILSFLSNWVTHHILETDVKFGSFIDVQRIRKRIKK
jgi:hemerythrin